MWNTLLLFLLVLVFKINSQNHSPPPTTYRVAVAPTEFHRNQTTDLDLTANINFMKSQIQKASQQGAQIVLFGEQQVNFPDAIDTSCSWRLVVQTNAEYIPTITEGNRGMIIPCGNPLWQNRTIASQFSCAARDYGIYVVYSAYTSYPCTEAEIGTLCPPGGILVFNTLVVLDRHGALVAKYYKRNIQTEAPGVVQPTPALLAFCPDNPIFTTDFGVSFGLIICYDVARGYPLQDLMGAGIRNFLWSNAFVGMPGFLTHVGIAQGWARAAGVNVICASDAAKGISGGNAIISGPRTLAVNFKPARCTGEYADEVPYEDCFDLVIADVPIVPYTVPERAEKLNWAEKSAKKSGEKSSWAEKSAKKSEEKSSWAEKSAEKSGWAEKLGLTEKSIGMESSEPYACDPFDYLPDGIPSWVQPVLGLEATCASGVAIPGENFSLSATFGEISCVANFSVSGNSPGDLRTKFTLHSSEIIFWMPDTPCPLRGASCYISAEFPECTDNPDCPPNSYESPTLFSEISVLGHFGSEYSVVPFSMENGGTMSTDQYEFKVTNRTSINSGIPEIVYSVTSRDVTVIFTSLFGIYSEPNWPGDCNSCYDPFKGPEFSELSHFAPETLRGSLRYFMCSECDDNDGWKNEPVWPPAWAHG